MNIFKTITNYEPNAEEYNKLCSKINLYKQKIENPILLMNDETASYLIFDIHTYGNYKDPNHSYLSFIGLKVAIANWLETGEVIFVNEISTY